MFTEIRGQNPEIITVNYFVSIQISIGIEQGVFLRPAEANLEKNQVIAVNNAVIINIACDSA